MLSAAASLKGFAGASSIPALGSRIATTCNLHCIPEERLLLCCLIWFGLFSRFQPLARLSAHAIASTLREGVCKGLDGPQVRQHLDGPAFAWLAKHSGDRYLFRPPEPHFRVSSAEAIF